METEAKAKLYLNFIHRLTLFGIVHAFVLIDYFTFYAVLQPIHLVENHPRSQLSLQNYFVASHSC